QGPVRAQPAVPAHTEAKGATQVARSAFGNASGARDVDLPAHRSIRTDVSDTARLRPRIGHSAGAPKPGSVAVDRGAARAIAALCRGGHRRVRQRAVAAGAMVGSRASS